MSELPTSAELRAQLRDRVTELTEKLEASDARNRQLESRVAMQSETLTDLASLLKRDFHLDKATHDAIRRAIEDSPEDYVEQIKAQAKADCLEKVAATMVRDMSKQDISKLAEMYREEASR